MDPCSLNQCCSRVNCSYITINIIKVFIVDSSVVLSMLTFVKGNNFYWERYQSLNLFMRVSTKWVCVHACVKKMAHMLVLMFRMELMDSSDYSTIVLTPSLKQYIGNYKLMRLFWILNLQLQSCLGKKNVYFPVIRKQFTQMSRNNQLYHFHNIFFSIKSTALNDGVNISICFRRVQKRNFSLSFSMFS